MRLAPQHRYGPGKQRIVQGLANRTLDVSRRQLVYCVEQATRRQQVPSPYQRTCRAEQQPDHRDSIALEVRHKRPALVTPGIRTRR